MSVAKRIDRAVEMIRVFQDTHHNPGSHGPRCWRLPGHHRCAIEKLQGAEGAAKLGVVDEGEIEAAQGSLEL